MFEPLVNIFETNPEFGVSILIVAATICIFLGGCFLWLLAKRESIGNNKITELEDQVAKLEAEREKILGGDEKSISSYAVVLRRLVSEAELLLSEYSRDLSRNQNLIDIIQEIKRLSCDIEDRVSDLEASQIIESKKSDWTKSSIQAASIARAGKQDEKRGSKKIRRIR